MNEADTCCEYVLPKLQQAGWEQAPHGIVEQQAIIDGIIITLGQSAKMSTMHRRADRGAGRSRGQGAAVVC